MNDSFKDQFMIYNGFCQNLAVYSTCLSIQNQFRINASQPRRYSKLSDSHSQLLKPISNSRIAGFSVASLSNLWARYQMLVPPLGCNDCQFHWSLRNKSTSEFQECLEDYQPAFFTQINAWKKTSIMVHNHFLQRYFFTKCPTAQVLPFLKSMLWMFFPSFSRIGSWISGCQGTIHQLCSPSHVPTHRRVDTARQEKAGGWNPTLQTGGENPQFLKIGRF